MGRIKEIYIERYNQFDNFTAHFTEGLQQLKLTATEQRELCGFFMFIFYGRQNEATTPSNIGPRHISQERQTTIFQLADKDSKAEDNKGHVGGFIVFAIGETEYKVARYRTEGGVNDLVRLWLKKPGEEEIDIDLSNKTVSPGRMLFGTDASTFIDNLFIDTAAVVDKETKQLTALSRSIFIEEWADLYTEIKKQTVYDPEKYNSAKELFVAEANSLLTFNESELRSELNSQMRQKHHLSAKEALPDQIESFIELRVRQYRFEELGATIDQLEREHQQLMVKLNAHDQVSYINRYHFLQQLLEEREQVQQLIEYKKAHKEIEITDQQLSHLLELLQEMMESSRKFKDGLRLVEEKDLEYKALKQDGKLNIHRTIEAEEQAREANRQIKRDEQYLKNPLGFSGFFKVLAGFLALTALVFFCLSLWGFIKQNNDGWISMMVACLASGATILLYLKEKSSLQSRRHQLVEDIQQNRKQRKQQLRDVEIWRSKVVECETRLNALSQEIQAIDAQINKTETIYNQKRQELSEELKRWYPNVDADSDLKAMVKVIQEKEASVLHDIQRLEQLELRIAEVSAGEELYSLQEKAQHAEEWLSKNKQEADAYVGIEINDLLQEFKELDSKIAQNKRNYQQLKNELCNLLSIEGNSSEMPRDFIASKCRIAVIHHISKIRRGYIEHIAQSLHKFVLKHASLEMEELKQADNKYKINVKRLNENAELMEQIPSHFLEISSGNLPLFVTNQHLSATYLKNLYNLLQERLPGRQQRKHLYPSNQLETTLQDPDIQLIEIVLI